MKQLLTLEYLKLKKLRSLKIILLIYIVVLPAALFGINSFLNNILGKMLPDTWSALQFPDVWSIATYSASWFNLILGILVVLIISNEYNFKTMRQHVIDGLSLQKVIIGKFLVIFFLSVFVTLYTFLVGYIYGIANTTTDVAFYTNINEVGKYFIQTLCYFSFALFVAVLIKKSVLSIVVFVLSFFAEAIVGILLKLIGWSVVYAFFPLNSFSSLIPFPIFKEMIKAQQESSGSAPYLVDTPVRIAVCLVYMLLFFFLAYRVVKKRDL